MTSPPVDEPRDGVARPRYLAPLRALRSMLVAVRDAVDALAHPLRRRRARARLARAHPGEVVFVCLGNICRSPYAARFLEARLTNGIRVRSAGFIGPGRSPPETALEVARAHGLDHADHRSRVATPELLSSADVLFVFDRANARRLRQAAVRPERILWLGDFDPVWSGKRAIVDPWGKERDFFELTFSRIERCLVEVQSVLCGITPGAPETTGRSP
ncbi:MAG TPA: hypothetical protein VFQ22_14300 [Longimicrobiales bacterium]|nr:hypothetical protein [Longimicrobiales bacterium]